MSSTSKRRRSTGLFAVTAALVAVLLWWSASGNGPQVFRGNAERLPGPGGAATPAAGLEVTAAPSPTGNDVVPLDSYVSRGDRRLVLNLTLDGCTGALESPTVVETEASVVVTLRWATSSPSACVEPDVRRSLTVDLDAPLGERGVLDGAYAPAVLVRSTAQAY